MRAIKIRPSSIGSFHSCPFKWANVHLLGVRSWSGFSALRGTGVHSGAELLWSESIKAGQKTINMSAIKDAAAQSVEDELNN